MKSLQVLSEIIGVQEKELKQGYQIVLVVLSGIPTGVQAVL